MKEYRLAAWPDLGAPYHQTRYRRALSDMSQRFVTASQLCASSGLRRSEIKAFVEMLEARGVAVERERTYSFFGALRSLSWFKRAISSTPI